MRAFYLVVLFSIVQFVTSDCDNNSIRCFECEYDDTNCKDPFNATLPLDKLPPLTLCRGCCVKMIRNFNTSNEKIRRTCTKLLRLNLYVDDHICMNGGGGRMCFCEDDMCNSAHSDSKPAVFFFFLSTAFFLNR